MRLLEREKDKEKDKGKGGAVPASSGSSTSIPVKKSWASPESREGKELQPSTFEPGDGSASEDNKPSTKKARKLWTKEETQMLIDGCEAHGVGNWTTILNDPSYSFQSRSATDLKDRYVLMLSDLSESP
ncbi:hypothetical protein DACRYDRAFT_54392 [Dacryopinax primogenitus]|uniref:Myb-like domain-containing protein n=1 Tax=Dacryopinax primogenitus (strain DJM 731) TaxID=1858805 RepID=M5G930_DACPD|nr:uncharacterized protein DACRYDRAFT_54392 [Dacryopinax primogenitus]EJU00293.1 hypothetical protein DACRYDRAFT_54392 [Dacryopinax primogenitus]